MLTLAYFAALRDTPVSLYEVSDVQPGASMALRDLLSDAEPVTVHERQVPRAAPRHSVVTTSDRYGPSSVTKGSNARFATVCVGCSMGRNGLSLATRRDLHQCPLSAPPRALPVLTHLQSPPRADPTH